MHEDVLAGHLGRDDVFGAVGVTVGRQQVHPGVNRGQAFLKGEAVDQKIEQACRWLGVNQRAHRALRVGVDEQHFQPVVGPATRQGQGGGGFGHAAALVGNGQPDHDALRGRSSCSRATSISGGRHQRRSVPATGAGAETVPSRIRRNNVMREMRSCRAAMSSETAFAGRGTRRNRFSLFMCKTYRF